MSNRKVISVIMHEYNFFVWTVALCKRAVNLFAGVWWWDKKPQPLSPRQHETVTIATTTFLCWAH